METLPESPQEPAVITPALDENKLYAYREKLKLDQNLLLACIGGASAALIGAVLWAVVTVFTKYQIGFMAVGIGFLVGFSVRQLGKGIDQIFGITGALLALAGCLLGNFFTLVAFGAEAEGLSFFQMLFSVDYSLVPEIMIETFSPMDVLFYGLAIYEGYKFSFRRLTEEEIMQNATS